MAGAADRGSVTDWIADRILRGLIGGLRLLPYPHRVRLMGWLMRRVVGPLTGYRRRARENLAATFPGWDAGRRRAVADAALDNFGRTLIENFSGTDLDRQLAGTVATGEGLAALDAAQAAGRPVIFVTGHFANHEAPRHVLHAMGYRIGGIYRAMDNPFFNAWYVRTLETVSGPVFERGRGTAGFVRHLRAGGLAAILFDVHDLRGEPVEFLGRPAMTSTSPADLALRYDAEVIPYFAIRLPDGLSFDVVVEAPIPHADPLGMMRAMTARLEARIAANPGQWFWVHRRWKPGRSTAQRNAAAATISPGPGS